MNIKTMKNYIKYCKEKGLKQTFEGLENLKSNNIEEKEINNYEI
ncbi:hypothetical protein [Clostridium yunnanense]|nr:hypothetical protein [Clostridium yunnanense]